MIKRYLLYLLLPAAVLVAQPEPGTGQKRMAMDDDLQLSKEQREQITNIRSSTQKQMIDLRAELEKLQLDLCEQLRADKPNRKSIDATLADMNSKRGAMEKIRVDQHLQIREILTPEQREIFDRRPFDGRPFDQGRGAQGHRRRPGGKRHSW